MTLELDQLHVGFIDMIRSSSSGKVCSGLLVTNAKTQPLNFYATEAIKPTTLQRILYGKTFNKYLINEVFGSSLIDAHRSKLDIIFVRDGAFLHLRLYHAVPICYIDLKDSRTPDRAIQVHRKYSSDEGFAKQVFTYLTDTLKHDLSEPFERVRLALNEMERSSAQAES
jgi:hypothetical protein